jgi:4,5-DOPA dioxygenase extradiol
MAPPHSRSIPDTAPETLHDFGGFPQALYQLRYPAPGAPRVASDTVALLKAAGIDASIDDRRGFDHGAWIPLLYLLPKAQVPVFQVSCLCSSRWAPAATQTP